MFPSIILNKIYWYKWRDLQLNLCEEYRKKQIFNDFPIGVFFNMNKRIYEFNYRTCINEDYDTLYENASGNKSKIPKSYIL